MAAIYLYLNAALYLIFAGWMTLSPWKTAAAVGYETLSSSGRSEYLVIYGGLQLGLAAMFIAAATDPRYHRFGLLLSLCLYVPIVLYRVVTVWKFWPLKSTTVAVASLEIALLIAAGILFVREGR